ncbi:flagellar biosynthesis protein FlhF [Candidatus Poribacteria bacterium]|nr:flagellar biosynthesis protein FlhF [Candidatus Poribacteria bacterium]
MIVRRYHGASTDEAVARAHEDLGALAVILLTKRTELGVEVVAAVDTTAAGASRQPEATTVRTGDAPASARTEWTRTQLARARSGYKSSAVRAPQVDPDTTTSPVVARARREQAQRAYGVATPSETRTRTPAIQLLRDRLSEQEVEEAVIQTFIRELGESHLEPSANMDTVREAVRRGIDKHLKVAGEIRTQEASHLIAFVGPTGVGKTTTIAKLAARYHLQEKRPVRLVSVDTYRIAGADQLRTYARILGVPCDVAATPQGLAEIRQQAPRGEMLFLDTPGRSPRNSQQLAELRHLLDAAEPSETHLVVSSTTRLADLWEIARGFHALDPNRLIFTKLDESASYGNIVNFSYHQRLPLAYFTTGQTVPDDIEAASPDRLAQLLLRTRRLRYA